MHQQQAIDTLLAAAREDDAVRAVFLKGSVARGGGDAYSDVDFYCIVHADKLEGFLARRKALLEQYRPVLFWMEVNHVGPQVIAIYNDGLHLDFYTVTQEKLPTGGTAKALYDPENLLADYKATTAALPFAEIVLHFDNFLFSLVQIETAVRREYLTWAHYLVEKLPGEFAYLYRYLYTPDDAMLSLKDFDRVLDKNTRNRMLQAHQSSVLEGIRIYIALMREIASDYPLEEKAVFNWTFFDFMARRIEALASERAAQRPDD